MWLEVHKLPKENWLIELDALVQAVKKQEEKKEEHAISEVVIVIDIYYLFKIHVFVQCAAQNTWFY